MPDWTFKGSSLTGTDQIGQAKWRAENGEIIGTPTSADGGWLLINPGYQDVRSPARTGALRSAPPASCSGARKSASGIKGIYTTLAGGPAAPAAVTVDAQGRIGNREPLTRSGGAMLRIQPPPPPPSPGRAGGAPGDGRAAGPAPARVDVSAARLDGIQAK